MTRVYIGHLSYRVRERDLEKFFRGFGKIREVLLKNGFGFVEFDDDRDADDAVYELNGRELDGERVVVELAHGTARRAPAARSYMDTPVNRYGPPTRTDYRVIIENLSSRISWQDLKDRMRQVGDVTYADAHRRKRNEGVVEFASYSDMRRAIDKLDNTELNGRRIRVIEEKPIRRTARAVLCTAACFLWTTVKAA
ncbi:serine/arginine-rich splicing factor 6 isoform X1 [Ixodes scapularis]